MTPLVVRPLENGEYEVISGHRRLFACKKLGIHEVPAIVYNIDRDTAAIALVDSNLHREHILPSEKANQKETVRIPKERLRAVLPNGLDARKTEEYIVKACEYYRRYLQRQRSQER